MTRALRRARALGAALAIPCLVAGCAGSDDGAPGAPSLPYASEVVRFEPGSGAGFGEDDFPEIVLGPPRGGGLEAGSLDVLSLGVAGEIVLAFGASVADGDGPDFVVFENAFYAGGDPEQVFAEPGEVAVSEDGLSFVAFPCDPGVEDLATSGCAGVTPTAEYDAAAVPLDPEITGGDAFDLALVGVARARYVRIRDLSAEGAGTSAGFDLDAVGWVGED